MKARRNLIGILIFLSVELAVVEMQHAFAVGIHERFFVEIEGNDSLAIANIIEQVREIGREAQDFAAFRTKLDTRWKTSVSRGSDYSVVHVSPWGDDTSALDRKATIDSFTGSPSGLLKRLTKETGIPMVTQQWFGGSIIRIMNIDHRTRIHVNHYHGSIRELFAETIPPSYSTLALSVICRPDGCLEVHHLGSNRFPADQFLADHVAASVSPADRLTSEEQAAEGSITLPRPGESDKDFLKRLVDIMISRLHDEGHK